jgi:primase-polymerase (primpol)-like protein
MRTCEWCGTSIVSRNAQARFCTSQHRVYAHRAAKSLPRELTTQNRWMRWEPQPRKGKLQKVPLQLDGSNAKSTDPNTWTSYSQAANSTIGVGLGFALGDGIGCIDLDHCLIGGKLTPAATEYLRDYPSHFIEISPSGDGLHIWGTMPEQPGRKQTINGLNIETYSTGRYITITGNTYQPGQLLPL